MKTLHRLHKQGVTAGDPLPAPYQIFEDRRIIFRRGGVHIIAATPGSLKTQFTLNILQGFGRWPTFFCSSDSDDFTMMSRVLSMESGVDIDTAEMWVANRSEGNDHLRRWSHVWWDFPSSPTVDSIYLEAEAHRELVGTYPYVIVLDALLDIDYEGVSDMNYWGIMKELKDLARDLNACVIGVHHATDAAKPGAPPSRGAIMGKAMQSPTLALTLDADGDSLKVAVVKNRFGPSSPSASGWFEMEADPARCRITELPYVETPIDLEKG